MNHELRLSGDLLVIQRGVTGTISTRSLRRGYLLCEFLRAHSQLRGVHPSSAITGQNGAY
jgi:hypothetical protein